MPAKADPFFQLDRSKGQRSHAGDAQPGAGIERGVEEVLHSS